MALPQRRGVPFDQATVERVGGLYLPNGALKPFSDDFFGPGKPPDPIAPPGMRPRMSDYPTGYNRSRSAPKSDEGISYPELRVLADRYTLGRLLIETRKDQLKKMSWTLTVKPKPGEPAGSVQQRSEKDPRITELLNFFEEPDRENDWPTWLGMLLEDALVLDAMAINLWPLNNGKPYALEPLDGATIKKYIDDTGRTPAPPFPAYNQYIKGMQAFDFTKEQLLFSIRNVRTNRLYGFSPVEQLLLYVNIALRRATMQLAHYTDGNIPAAFAKAPASWTAEQITRFQDSFDLMLAGDQAERSKIIWIPEGTDPVFPQKEVLKDEFDEWLARLACFCFSISPNFFIRQQNRASSESYWDQADAEGMLPWMQHVKLVITKAIRRFWKYPDIEFTWKWERELDKLKQAQVDDLYVKNRVYSVNEVRAKQGLDPIKEEAQPAPDDKSEPADNPLIEKRLVKKKSY